MQCAAQPLLAVALPSVRGSPACAAAPVGQLPRRKRLTTQRVRHRGGPGAFAPGLHQRLCAGPRRHAAAEAQVRRRCCAIRRSLIGRRATSSRHRESRYPPRCNWRFVCADGVGAAGHALKQRAGAAQPAARPPFPLDGHAAAALGPPPAVAALSRLVRQRTDNAAGCPHHDHILSVNRLHHPGPPHDLDSFCSTRFFDAFSDGPGGLHVDDGAFSVNTPFGRGDPADDARRVVG